MKIKLSRSKEYPSNDTKESTLEEPLIHLSIWIRNDVVMNEEDDKVEGSRRSLPTKQNKDNYSIVIS